MGTNFYWNTEEPDVLEALETLGQWRIPLRNGHGEPPTPEIINELRGMGFSENSLENMANPSPVALAELSHIGKRSGAGLFCYSCNSWFNNPSNYDKRPLGLRESCTYCGKQPEWSPNTSTNLKPGFEKSENTRPSEGVKTTCSFTWANWPDEVYRIALTAPPGLKLVIDEYGHTMTGPEFLAMLRSSVDITYMSIGDVFS